MASTLKPADAFNYAKRFIKEMPLESVGAEILDDVHKIMWMAAPWRWTVGSMPTADLAANTQDYTITVPGDFLFLVKAYLADGSTAPRDLEIEATLPTTAKQVGQPSRVAVVGSAFRVYPKVGDVSSPAPTLVSLYKKTSPTITRSNMYTAGTQVFDDEWFWVFREGVLWRAYLYADDSRAGNMTVQDGKVQFTGQRAVFEAGLNFMRQKEALPPLGNEGER